MKNAIHLKTYAKIVKMLKKLYILKGVVIYEKNEKKDSSI